MPTPAVTGSHRLRRRPPRHPARAGAVLAVVAALVLAACGGPAHHAGASGPSGSATTSTQPASSSGPPVTAATLALGEEGNPHNWNPLAAAAAGDPVLQTVAAAVLPSAFVVGPGLRPTRNAALVTAATQVSSSPQVIDYRINPEATWSDGTPVTAADFVYTWEADAGQRRFRDTGGHRFTPASTAGYDQVASVAQGAAGPDSVVVRFAVPDPDWRALFSPLLPARIGRRVGFDTGFTNPVTDLVSAGPFVVQSWRPGVDVVLARNPAWWGQGSALSTVTVDEVPNAGIGGVSVQQGQLDAAQLPFTPGGAKTLRATPGLSVWTGGSGVYDDLVPNERSGLFASVTVRRAVMLAVDRSALAQLAGTEGDVGAAPVANRAYLPGQPGYRNDRAALGPGGLTAGRALLAAAGYQRVGTTLETPTGKPVIVHLVVATTSTFTRLEATAVQSACRALGMTVSTRTAPAGSGLATLGRSGWDLALVARAVSAFPSILAARYASGSSANLAGYSSPAMDALVARVDRLHDGAARTAAVDAMDALAWRDAVDLPLLFEPQLLVSQSRYTGIAPSAGATGPAWDIADWAIPGGT